MLRAIAPKNGAGIPANCRYPLQDIPCFIGEMALLDTNEVFRDRN
jgi:hypothetical protein